VGLDAAKRLVTSPKESREELNSLHLDTTASFPFSGKTDMFTRTFFRTHDEHTAFSRIIRLLPGSTILTTHFTGIARHQTAFFIRLRSPPSAQPKKSTSSGGKLRKEANLLHAFTATDSVLFSFKKSTSSGGELHKEA